MKINLPSGTKAEVANPLNGDPERGMVIIPDVMGLRPLFVDLAKELAEKNQWSVCVFDLYPGQEDLEVGERLATAGLLKDEDVLGDAIAAAEATNCDPVGILGFCMGGMYTLKAAATQRFDRHCSFYGMIQVPDQWQGSGQGEPLESLELGDPSSVLAIIGSQDDWTPPDHVELLTKAGVKVVCYEEANHGFVHDASRPAHRPVEAADAWRQATQWFQKDC
tara:strand:- start:170 stop:832 length:663 start_codon:yes stop_codon:yes gene_type:complete